MTRYIKTKKAKYKNKGKFNQPRRTVIQKGNEINPTMISDTAKLMTKKLVLVLSLLGPLKYAIITNALPKMIIKVIMESDVISPILAITLLALSCVLMLHVVDRFVSPFVILDVTFVRLYVTFVRLVLDCREQFCILFQLVYFLVLSHKSK